MSTKRKLLKVSGLIESGKLSGESLAVLPRFKGQEEFTESQLIDVPLSKIVPNPYQPRRIFPENEIDSIAESINEVGLIHPIVLRKVNDDLYQIIAGERRYRAHLKLERDTIRSVLYTCDEGDMAIMAMVENFSREDLSDYEIAQGLHRIEKEFPTKTKLAEALGLNREDMYRYFSFDSLPEFLIEKLQTNPRLLGRRAADEIKRALNNCQAHELDVALDALKEAISLLEEGVIGQGQIAKAVVQKVKLAISEGVKMEREEFFIDNKKIGSFSKSKSGITIRISSGILDTEKEHKLKSLVNDLIN
jgi:ParB family chromosome partitioning protein